MNERIRELFLQAGFHPPVVKRMGDEYKFEKFAELIVRECMNICEQQRLKILNNSDDPSWSEHLAECKTAMEQTLLRN